MLNVRVIPCLLLRNRGLVKTVRFDKMVYVGDPINTVRIFNEKEVDELIFLDILATRDGRPPQYELIQEIASECFMPFAYGGGVRDLDQMRRIFSLGVEKVALNTAAFENPELVTAASVAFGRQSVIVSMDVRRDWWGRYEVWVRGGRSRTRLDPVSHARKVEALGAGEILLTSIDRDGTFSGFDLNLIKAVVNSVKIPVIACGGAGSLEDLGAAAKEGGAAAVAAGSIFVYQGRNRGVLVNFPSKIERRRVLAGCSN